MALGFQPGDVAILLIQTIFILLRDMTILFEVLDGDPFLSLLPLVINGNP